MNTLIKGQPIVNKLIENISNNKKYSQAYILTGNDKKELNKCSILLAQSLICPNKFNKDCSKCNICSRIKNNEYSELKIINPQNNIIKKEEIVNLKKLFVTDSIEGKNNVYIINDVELLHQSSANSILKFLEEPDCNVVAIFTTTNISKVINTIISRCQIIKLSNIKEKIDIEYIEKITNFDIEKINIAKKFFINIEKDLEFEIITIKEKFLKQFLTKDDIKSVFIIGMLIYTDVINFKVLNKMEYFEDDIEIKNVYNNQNIDNIIKKANLVLENIQKLDYNLNIFLFMVNFLIEIGEINNGKSSRN